GELFISHSFSLLGGRKNRDYDGSPFYFLVLHLVYESKPHNKRLKRDCQRVAFLPCVGFCDYDVMVVALAAP
ncbi:hypothetical protein, partial [Vibrio cholerae]|nr:hypothetical protein [Vibrio cholerae]